MVAFETECHADSPTVMWRMDALPGANLVDVIGGKVATKNGNPTYGVAGPIEGRSAIAFSNIADFFSTPDHADLDLGDGPFTIECLLYRNLDNGSQQGVCRKGANGYAVNIQGPSDCVGIGKQTVTHLCRASTTIVVGAGWRHYVITRSAAGAGNTLIYTDGVEGHVDDAAIGTALEDTTGALEIGKDDSTLDGALAYLVIYKGTVLSAARILAHHDARLDRAIRPTYRSFPRPKLARVA